MADSSGPWETAKPTEGERLTAEQLETLAKNAVTRSRPRPLFRIIDVGCGPGLYVRALAKAFGDAGNMLGLDPDPALHPEFEGRYTIDQVGIFEHYSTGYDLALCLEVAEHVHADDAERFIQKLCTLAPLVIFSAAAPGQGGDGHIHCQPKGYWLELFSRFGFAPDATKTAQLVQFMGAGYHMGWLTQNVMVLTSYGYRNFGTIAAEEARQAERLATFLSEMLPFWSRRA